MKCCTVFTLAVLHAGCSVFGALSLSLVSDVSHMVGYEASSPFEHVAGSACCLDFSIPVDSLEACRSHCMTQEFCGSFLFDAAAGECFLISEGSNFELVEGPDGCEKRCVDQEECEAFVFAPASQLCFLVRFPEQDSNGIAAAAAVRLAEDRVFGLVRDTALGKLHAEISASLSANAMATIAAEGVDQHSGTRSSDVQMHAAANDVESPHLRLGSVLAAFALVACATLFGFVLRWTRSAQRTMSATGLEPGKVEATEAFTTSSLEAHCEEVGEGVAIATTAAPMPLQLSQGGSIASAVGVASIAKAAAPMACSAGSSPGSGVAALVPNDENASPVRARRAQRMSPLNAGAVAMESTPVASTSRFSPVSQGSTPVSSSGNGISPPKAAFAWREKEVLVPVRRSVDFAGPTNYPVAGEASPFARCTPQKLMMRELVEGDGGAEAEVAATVAADVTAEDVSDSGLQEPVAATASSLSRWFPEVLLALGAVLLGALRHPRLAFTEPKTAVVMTIAFVCIAAALGHRCRMMVRSSESGVVEARAERVGNDSCTNSAESDVKLGEKRRSDAESLGGHGPICQGGG